MNNDISLASLPLKGKNDTTSWRLTTKRIAGCRVRAAIAKVDLNLATGGGNSTKKEEDWKSCIKYHLRQNWAEERREMERHQQHSNFLCGGIDRKKEKWKMNLWRPNGVRWQIWWPTVQLIYRYHFSSLTFFHLFFSSRLRQMCATRSFQWRWLMATGDCKMLDSINHCSRLESQPEYGDGKTKERVWSSSGRQRRLSPHTSHAYENVLYHFIDH